MDQKIQVLIVDDSALVRQSLSDILKSDPQLEVMAVASDPFVAAKKMRDAVPDVILLDIEMPRMDGITFLQKLMKQRPIPVVICSSLTEKGSAIAMKALDYGAVDVIHKPRLGTKEFLNESRILICDAVKAAALTKLEHIEVKPPPVSPKLSADAVLPQQSAKALLQTTEKVIVVGASTGGTNAIQTFLEGLSIETPGIVIVQHMPEHFTTGFANRLNETCQITVKEAEENDSVLPGQALIAPGNQHILLKRSGTRYYVELKKGPLVSRHRPSVDVLFRSAAQYAGINTIGVILTGMGDDGARGMLEMKEAGAFTIAQDEASSVVFGMPREAIELGGVDRVLPLNQIASEVMRQRF